MFTLQLLGDRKDEKLRRRIINVKFISTEKEFDQEFQFNIDEDNAVIKKAVNQFLDELNYIPPTLTDLDPVPDPVPEEPTQAEIERDQWFADRQKLRTLMELVRDGVFTGSEKQITDLQTKIRADFKVTYLD